MRYLNAFVALALLTPAAHAARLTTLATFNGQNGARPVGGVIADTSGNLFGTTSSLSAFFETGGFGTIFKLDMTGVLTTLADFNGENGAFPLSSLIADSTGNLFGTTLMGGAFGFGTVFKLDAIGRLTTLVHFDGQNGDQPFGGLIADASGSLFGTTFQGGIFGGGTVFRLDTDGLLTTLVNFNGQNGGRPAAGIIADESGNLFGTTSEFGAFGLGTVFKLDRTGTLTTLVNFNGQNGVRPSSDLITDASGNLFGTTFQGGSFGLGTVFKIDTTGTLTTLASFNGQNGLLPSGGLIIDSSGNLFGTTIGGGFLDGFSFGTVFKLDTTGRLTTLVHFDGLNGEQPSGKLIADASGNLFGTTISGSEFGFGTIFRISDVNNLAVPEPATWAMMLFGFGYVGSALRRRQSRRTMIAS